MDPKESKQENLSQETVSEILTSPKRFVELLDRTLENGPIQDVSVATGFTELLQDKKVGQDGVDEVLRASRTLGFQLNYIRELSRKVTRGEPAEVKVAKRKIQGEQADYILLPEPPI